LATTITTTTIVTTIVSATTTTTTTLANKQKLILNFAFKAAAFIRVSSSQKFPNVQFAIDGSSVQCTLSHCEAPCGAMLSN